MSSLEVAAPHEGVPVVVMSVRHGSSVLGAWVHACGAGGAPAHRTRKDRCRYLKRKQDCRKCYETVMLMGEPCEPAYPRKIVWALNECVDGRGVQQLQQTARSGMSALVRDG